MSEIKTLNGYLFVDSQAREGVRQLSEEITELKGSGTGGAKDYTVSKGHWDSNGVLQMTESSSLHTSLIAVDDIEYANFTQDYISGTTRYVVLYDENENFIKRLTRNLAGVVSVVPSSEEGKYTYFAIAWYNPNGASEDVFRGFIDIKYKENDGVDFSAFAKNNMSEYRYAMPKWAGIHPWIAFEGVTDDDVNNNDFGTWYGRFHELTETYANVGLEEINLSTDYLAANTSDAIPAAISSLNNGGLYMWHLPAPSADGSGLTVKHKTLKIILTSGVHGDETSSVWCAWKLLDALCRNDAEHRAITLLRNFCDIYMIPLVNPYGIEEFTRRNENDININRDFAVPNWVASSEEGVPDAPNSQYSTRCVSWWIDKIAPDGMVDMHASFGSNTMESGMFVQWGFSGIPAIASVIEENVMDVTPYIRKNLAPKFDNFQHWFGHTAEITSYRNRLGMASVYAYHKGIMSATYEVVRRVQWDGEYVLSGDDEPSICAMNYHGIVNFLIKFVQTVVETLNSGIDWRNQIK